VEYIKIAQAVAQKDKHYDENRPTINNPFTELLLQQT